MPWKPANDGDVFGQGRSIDLARDDFADLSYERARERQGRLPYVPEDAEVRFEHPFEQLDDDELTFFALHRTVGDFASFVSKANLLYVAAAEAPKEEKENHKSEPVDDQERSDFVASIFDNTQRMLRSASGGLASFVAETVFQVQQWAINGNNILMEINIGWMDHLRGVSWGPAWAKATVDSVFSDLLEVEYKTRPTEPRSSDWVRQHVKKIADALEHWEKRADVLRHRIAVCAQAHDASLKATLAPPKDSKIPMPAKWFRDEYDLEPETLKAARKDGRIKRAVFRRSSRGKGGRWFYHEDEVLAVWPERRKTSEEHSEPPLQPANPPAPKPANGKKRNER